MSASNEIMREDWPIGEYQISGGVNIEAQETSAECLPAKVYYYFPIQRNGFILGQKIWFLLDHGLLFNAAEPLKLEKRTKLNRQVKIGAPGAPYYPFVNYEAWIATKEILTSPGIAKIGICCGLFWFVTTRRCRERQIALRNLKTLVSELMWDISGREVEFEEAGWYRLNNKCHWYCRSY